MRALVTGGTGFLGSRIAQLLHERGDEVLATTRDPRRRHPSTGVQTLVVDLADSASILQALRGVDVIFHVAARTGVWGPREAFHQANVVGTQNVLDACRVGGIARLVYTSSPSVVFDGRDLCGQDESLPYPSRHLCHYAATKAQAEQMVLRAHGSHLATVALRPHLIFGPGDPHLLPRVVARARAGRLRQIGEGRNVVDLTYVDNAAQAHLDAADRLGEDGVRGGKAYFVSNDEPVALWPWINELLARLRLPPAGPAISLRTAYRVGALLEGIYAALRLRGEPPMTRFLATQLAQSHYFDISAARRDLGYAPRVSLADGLNRWLAWREAGKHVNPGS